MIKANLLVLATLVSSVVFSASAKAQSASFEMQGSGQWRNSGRSTGTSTYPQLGAMRGNENGHHGSGASGRAAGKVVTGGSQMRNTTNGRSSTELPLLGAPKDYDERYQLNLDGDLDANLATNRPESYRLTPEEQLLSSGAARRLSRSSTGGPSYAGQSNKGRGGARRTATDVGSVAVHSESSGASQFGLSGSPRVAVTGGSVYRSPW